MDKEKFAQLAQSKSKGAECCDYCEKQSSRSGLFFLSQSDVASGLNGRLRRRFRSQRQAAYSTMD